MSNVLRLMMSFLILAFIGCGKSSDGTMPNHVPSAIASFSIENSTVTLDGSNSSDSDGNIVKYEWYEDGTLIGEEKVLTKSDFSKGNHTITLKVTDDKGDTNQKSITFTLENQPPIAKIKTLSSVQEDTIFTLDGSKSSDKDGEIVKYDWYEGDTLLGSGKTYKASLSGARIHKITLKVTDDNGAVGSDEANVTITPKPVTPTPPTPNPEPTPDPEPIPLPTDTTKPTATITPNDGNISVSIDSNVTITFSEEMNTSTLNSTNITLKQGATNVAYTQTQSGNVLTLNPNSNFANNTPYTLTIQDVTDKAGNKIDTTTSTFTTIPAPVITTTKPLKTGQTKSYNASGAEVTDGSIKDDGFYQKGVERSYTRDDVNNIVKDNVTGLEWQDEPYTAQEDTAYSDNTEHGKTLNYNNAITYCTNLPLDGGGWRLPTIDELETIVDYGRAKNIPTDSIGAISKVFKNLGKHYGYWSSTTYLSDTSDAWDVYFYNGHDYWDGKTDTLYVRCTR